MKSFFSPITRKRLARFRSMKLAWISFWMLAGLYVLSLGSGLIANGNPLYVQYKGKSYFPIFSYYPEDTFVQNSTKTRPDYKKIRSLPGFAQNPDNFMIFAPVKFGPLESVDPGSIQTANHVTVTIKQIPRLGTININHVGIIKRANQAGSFFNINNSDVRGLNFFNFFKYNKIFEPNKKLEQALFLRFDNKDCPRICLPGKDTLEQKILVCLSTFKKRRSPPKTVRITLKDPITVDTAPEILVFDKAAKLIKDQSGLWNELPEKTRQMIIEKIRDRFKGFVAPFVFKKGDFSFNVKFDKEEIRFPYPPTKGHWLGIDSAGRDVLARILYGLRISLSFGLILVCASMFLGTMAGALQGYFGGLTDIAGQRFIEIWSALPFLYVMILLGSVYGRSFMLLLVCYGIFNWIGISYYMRAEFLRLRKLPFVESAKCMGIGPRKIIFKHILPNALVPIVTFFPFSLVGAIGSLAALDYLGFGLPPPTASWGELLSQAQSFRWAWWLILYPSLALFVVMLLGVFIGEGVRNAFDPKQYSRLR